MAGMAIDLKIEEAREGLTISLVEATSVRRFTWIALEVLAICLFLRLVPFANALLRLFVGGLVALVLIKDTWAVFRGSKVVLRISNLELISKGHSPGGYSPSTVPRAEICGLEYRCASGGGDVPEQPRGLYVERRVFGNWNAGTCVLPLLDKGQTEQVIEHILRRFPDTGFLSRAEAIRSPFIPLHLKGE